MSRSKQSKKRLTIEKMKKVQEKMVRRAHKIIAALGEIDNLIKLEEATLVKAIPTVEVKENV